MTLLSLIVTIQYPHSYEHKSMQKLQYEQVRYANGFVPATTTLSHVQRSKCADLLNSYAYSYFDFNPV